ncbi:MAG: CopG family transcriptional regulator [Acidobacteria bacterium]|nr:CopG family transcriptional regulator [Acidobacteriota bacterium]
MRDEDIDFSDVPELGPDAFKNGVRNWRPGQPLPRRGRPPLTPGQEGDAPVTSVRFPPALLERLRAAAAREGVGIGDVIRRAVEHELARQAG